MKWYRRPGRQMLAAVLCSCVLAGPHGAAAQETKPETPPGGGAESAAEVELKRRLLRDDGVVSQIRAQQQKNREQAAQAQAAQAQAAQAKLQVLKERILADRYRVLLQARVAGNELRMGMEVAGVDDILRSHLDLAPDQGVVVTSVAENGPAAQAGIVKNDILIRVQNQDLAGAGKLEQILQQTTDQPVRLVLLRKGRRVEVTVTPRAPQGEARGEDDVIRLEAAPESRAFWLGVGLSPADDTLRAQLGIEAQTGLVVTHVEADSPALKAGVLANDVLLKLDGTVLGTVEALAKQLQEVQERSVPLELLRRGKPAQLTVTPERRPANHQFVAEREIHNLNVDFTPLRDLQQRDLTVLKLGRLNWNLQAYNSGVVDYTNAIAAPVVRRQLAELRAQVDDLRKKLDDFAGALNAIQSPDAAPAEKNPNEKNPNEKK